jgi:putative transposase
MGTVVDCSKKGAHLFGEIDNGIMALNDAGRMIEKIWHDIPNDFMNINLHEYITMPNHFTEYWAS